MDPYYVEPAMLGDDATAQDAARMVELLQARGYNVEIGSALHNTDEARDTIPQSAWDDCLDILSREKFS